MLSNEAKAFLQYCWKDGKSRIISPLIGEKYTINDKMIAFTEVIYDEFIQCERVKVDRFGKKVIIKGLQKGELVKPIPLS